jgi:hypothetical protein
MATRRFYGKVRSIQTSRQGDCIAHRVFISTGHPKAIQDATLEVLESGALEGEFLAELRRAQNHGFSVSVTLEDERMVDLHVD